MRDCRGAARVAVAVLAAAALLGGALAGCGTSTVGPPPATSTTTSGPPTSSAPPTSTSAPTVPTEPGGQPTDGVHGRPPVSGPLTIPPADQAGPTVTVHGTVTQAETQPSCLVFRTDAGQQFQFVGAAATTVGHPAQALSVLVTGHIGPNMLSHCMLGRPFVADTVGGH